MIQAAHFDIKSVTGLRQALVLSAEYENEPFPLEGYTLHGSIGTYPRMDLKCSVDENGRARIEWDSVPPGNWKYDVFLISASNDETPLMEGTFTALPRITPVLDDESVNDEVGGVLHLPSGNEGTITLEVDGGFVSKLKTSSLDAENVEASTINLVDSYDLSCIDLMPFYGSPDEASLIFHPAQTGPGTTDYDIQLYFTYGSSGGFADWLAGPSIQMMRFHPAIGFYNAVSYSNPVVFLGSATFSALLKAQQAEIDQLKINSPLYKEGFLAWQDAGGLSMTRPSITESLYDADNPKAMLNREDNDQRYLQVKSLTAAEYAALGSYSLTTLYRITDADPAAVYLGDLKLSVAAD